MLPKKLFVLLSLVVICVVFFNARSFKSHTEDIGDQKIRLGEQIFFDQGLSNPVGQSCASCHRPEVGFSDPTHFAISAGAVPDRFGVRNSPSISYSAYTPVFYFNTDDSVYTGGFFLDGRAKTLSEQAKHPLFNGVEMNNTSAAMVIHKLQQAFYYPLYKKLYGDAVEPEAALANITEAIASYEQSPALNAFTSKFDFYLKGMEVLTLPEMNGLKLFNDPAKGNCATCHPSTADPVSGKVLFTDFTYDNIGIPANALNNQSKDHGLGGVLNNSSLYGSFKVPGLRNVALSYPYGHNGYFKTLEEVVHFYNKRDVEPFAAADFPATVNRDELGNLHLTDQEEKDIVAFLKTLTDGYTRW